jgi:hypothetical protein
MVCCRDEYAPDERQDRDREREACGPAEYRAAASSRNDTGSLHKQFAAEIILHLISLVMFLDKVDRVDPW